MRYATNELNACGKKYTLSAPDRQKQLCTECVTWPRATYA